MEGSPESRMIPRCKVAPASDKEAKVSGSLLANSTGREACCQELHEDL